MMEFARLAPKLKVSPIEEQLIMIQEIRDNMETVISTDYETFMRELFPLFFSILRDTAPQFADTVEQKLRFVILEIFNRLPNNDVLRPYVSNLLRLNMDLLESENEENAMICLRIIIDLHKNYRPTLEPQVQPFLEIVQKIYCELPKTVASTFKDTPEAPTNTADNNNNNNNNNNNTNNNNTATPNLVGSGSSIPSPSQTSSTTPPLPNPSTPSQTLGAPEQAKPTNILIPSMASFKVLTECPIIVVLLFQLYPTFLSSYVPRFMPLIVSTLGLQAEPNARLQHKSQYTDFIAAQVKTLSFLAYMLRGFADQLRPFQENIPKHVIQLLLNCPNESASIRKELLIATRHILATDLRVGFVSQIDTLIDEKVLIGTGRTAYETLRPLAYSTLADLVHHVRVDLSLPQLARVVYLYSKNIHDNTLSFSIQTMSAKLLLNLVECITRKNDQEALGRTLLVRILDAFVHKFNSLKKQIPKLLEEEKSLEPNTDPIKECRGLMKTLVLGLKNIVWGISNCGKQQRPGLTVSGNIAPNLMTPAQTLPAAANHPNVNSTMIGGASVQIPVGQQVNNNVPPVAVPGVPTIRPENENSQNIALNLATKDPSGNLVGQPSQYPTVSPSEEALVLANEKSSVEECLIFIRLLKNGLKCFLIYKDFPQEEKDILDHFAAVFTMVDARIFQDVFTVQIEFLFERMLENNNMLHIPQHFLHNPGVSRIIADILLNFLIDHIEDLSGSDKEKASVILRLFKLVFASVTFYADNETILQPHLSTIVISAMKHATTIQDSANYFILLRTLFRNVAGGKFDLFFNQFTPLIPELVSGLTKLQNSFHTQGMRDLFVELALTIPVRLSALLPNLDLLMKPLVLALESNNELVVQGLRTLELCIDTLEADILEKLVIDFKPELTLALWSHLKPPPYPHGPHALRILGKLAGRNRAKFQIPQHVYNQEPISLENSFKLQMKFSGCDESLPPEEQFSGYINLGFGKCLDLARKLFVTSSDVNIIQQSYELVKLCVGLLISKNGSSDQFKYQNLQTTFDENSKYTNTDFKNFTPNEICIVDEDLLMTEDDSTSVKSFDDFLCERKTAVHLLKIIIMASVNENLKEVGAIQFFEAICMHFSFIYAMQRKTDFTKLLELDDIFLDSVVSVMASDNKIFVDAALEALSLLFKNTTLITGSEERASELDIWSQFSGHLCHCCYKTEWYNKLIGTTGLTHLVSLLPVSWLISHQIEIIRALLFVLNNLTYEVNNVVKTIIQVVEVCYSNHDPAPFKGKEKSGDNSILNNLLAILALELASPAKVIRKTAHDVLTVLSEKTSTPIQNLLEVDVLLAQLFSVPLKLLSIPTQIGYIDAARYLLSLEGTLVKFSPGLQTFLKDTLIIAEIKLPNNQTNNNNNNQNNNQNNLNNSAGNTPVQSVVEQPVNNPSNSPNSNETQNSNNNNSNSNSGSQDELNTSQNSQNSDQQFNSNNNSSNQKPSQLGNKITKSQIRNLRIVSIGLLAASFERSDFDSEEFVSFRDEIMFVFFRALTIPPTEIVEVTKAALISAHAKKLLTNEMVQASLKPLLFNLSDHKKLSTSFLQGLAELLDIFDPSSLMLNATLGQKFLELLRNWTDPTKMPQQRKAITNPEETAIAASILNIFHLLPRAASELLEQIIHITIQLESLLPREISSPYREPLIKYLNRYSKIAIDFFLDKLHHPTYSNLLWFILREENAKPLLNELSCHEKLKTLIQQPGEAQFQTLLLIHTLVKFLPDWLPTNRPIVDCLIELWNSSARKNRLESEQLLPLRLPLHHLKESKLLIKCFLNYCSHRPEELSLLFEMLSIFTVKSTMNYSFLQDFYKDSINDQYSTEQKLAILQHFLTFFQDPEKSQEHKVQALQVLIIPLLNTSFSNGIRGVTNPEVLSQIINEIVHSEQQNYCEALNIELLQLATLLVRWLKDELVEHRKNLIRFAWNHLKSEDTTSKQCAYVLVCRFIEAYDTPQKIVLQVYVALLRSYQPEARSLVKQALDILLPSLRERLTSGDIKYPTWIKWTKKIIVEEGHSLPLLVHIFLLLVRHPDLFYSSRGQFIPHIVNSLARIGLLPNSPHENRKLSVDLVQLIVHWEKQRIESKQSAENVKTEVKQEGEAMETDQTNPTPPEVKKEADTEAEYEPSTSTIEMIVHFLIRVSSMSEAPRESLSSPQISPGPLSQQALLLLRDALNAWPAVNIKFAYFDKLLSPTAEQPLMVSTGLNILNVIADFQLRAFILVNSEPLHQALIPALTCDKPKILQGVSLLLEKIIAEFPIDTQSDISNFYVHIGGVIDQNLKICEKSPSSISKDESIVVILKTIAEKHPPFVDKYLPVLVKIFQKLTRDYIVMRDTQSREQNTPAQIPGQINDANLNNPADPNRLTQKKTMQEAAQMLILLLKLINSRVGSAPEQKKIFMSTLISLIERSQEIELLTTITEIISSCIVTKDENQCNLNLTNKEKITLILKMTRFDLIPNPELQVGYLEIVYQVYTENDSSEVEMNQLAPAFMMGLRCKNQQIRNKFFGLYHSKIKTTLQQRLEFIFNVQNWESLAGSFWIKQTLNLLLALTDSEAEILLGQNSASIPNITTPTIIPSNRSVSAFPSPGELRSSKGKIKPTLNSSKEAKLLVVNHQEFLEGISTLKTSTFIAPLLELLHHDSGLAHELWLILFPQIWNCATPSKRPIETSLIHLLSQEYHLKQQYHHPNVVQTLVESSVRCTNISPENPISIPVPLLKYLAKTYNCWHTIIKVLEEEVYQQDASSEKTDLNESLASLYSSLNESDYFVGLWVNRATVPDTKVGLILEQHGMWHAAQEVYFNTMKKCLAGSPSVPTHETLLWESHWIECSKHLNQWELLSDYAKSNSPNNSNTELLLQCAWKIADCWPTMKEALARIPNSSFDDNPVMMIYQSFIAIQEGKITDLEKYCQKAINVCLKQWVSLPLEPAVVLTEHYKQHKIFQQIIELQESGTIVQEINATTSRHQFLPEIKNILSTWRKRLPSLWDDVITWNDVLTWRQHVYTLVNNAFHSLVEVNSAVAYIGYHEMAWSINKFSHVARKHELVEVCLNSLSKIYTLPNIEIQDAFVKLREQVKCYFQLPVHFRTGLGIINSTNLDFFGPQQKAEFFQLKGEFLSRLGFNDEANNAFSTSISISDDVGKSWVSWGSFCDRQVEDALQEEKITWVQYAVSCYLQSIRCRNTNTILIPRILTLLKHDNEESILSNLVEQGSHSLPAWIWMNWSPQILNTFSKSRVGSVLKNLIKRIAILFPQGFYHRLKIEKKSLTNFMESLGMLNIEEGKNKSKTEERKSKRSKLNSNDTEQMELDVDSDIFYQDNAIHINWKNALSYFDEIILAIESSHPHLVQDVNSFVNNLSLIGKNSPQVELYFQLSQIRKKCQKTLYKIALENNKKDVEQQHQRIGIPEHINSLFTSLFENLFAAPTQPGASNRKKVKPEQSDFQKEFSSQFTHDFGNLEKDDLPDLIERITEWINNLSLKPQLQTHIVNLENFAPNLVNFSHSFDIEIPGQYNFSTSYKSHNHNIISSFHSEMLVLRGKKIIKILDTNGKEYCFQIDANKDVLKKNYQFRAEERYNQFLGRLNTLLGKYKETGRRSIQASFLQIDSFDTNLHLVTLPETAVRVKTSSLNIALGTIFNGLSNWSISKFKSQSLISFAEVWERHCLLNNGTDLNSPLKKWLELSSKFSNLESMELDELAQNQGQTSLNPNQIFKKIQKKVVPEDIFSNFVTSSLDSVASIFAFRKSFSIQLALRSLLQYVLSIQEFNPEKIIFSKYSAQIYSVGSYFNTINFQDDKSLPPFRLTPNLVNFITEIGMEGVFKSAMLSTAFCLASSQDKLRNYLNIFIEEDLQNVLVATKKSKQDTSKFELKMIDQTTVLNRTEFDDTVTNYQNSISDKITTLTTPLDFVDKKDMYLIPINKKVSDLIETASSIESLSQVDPNYLPWF